MGGALLAACVLPATGQTPARQSETVPIYRVTVIQRSVEAVNYQYRSGPTKIDFHGTVLMPKIKGDATVESRRGRTEIELKLENVEESQRFGREYLTYVLWAITPEGRPHNLGEILPGSSDKAKLRVTTDLQAFGLIVTAEPYSAVRQPSDVVVAENAVRPDTTGKFEPIHARYELMPRGQYTWQKGAVSPAANAPKVSMSQYEAISELYQARNAVGIARSASAERYAPNTMAKAQQLLDEAERLQQSKSESRLVVQNARQAAQTAEDARVIAERRSQEEKISRAQAEISAAQQARTQAEADAARARTEAEAARAQAESERAARERAEAEAAAARAGAAHAAAQSIRPQSEVSQPSRREVDRGAMRPKAELRMRLLERLNGMLTTRDTPRGLVVTVSDAHFSGPSLRGAAPGQLSRIAALLKAQPGLRVEVEGHTDSPSTEALASRRAEAVRGALLLGGLPAQSVAARGFGSTRPLYSNASSEGRVENRRVEIVISGDPIGDLPFWDRSYNLSLR
ncbi:MAG TPA: OmpA family protein [Bryobacteraceae bacterium]|nr:OmpA family protein [Bryobacteraceae bacterium]